MQVKREQINPTKVKLVVSAEQAELDRIKEHVLGDLKRNIKVPGFREGKAPAQMVEKQVDQNLLQSQFIEHAINDLYIDAVAQEKLRPAGQPEIAVVKFVPFNTLEFTAEFEAVGEIKLANYKNIKLPKPTTDISAEEVNTVINNLRQKKKSTVPLRKAMRPSLTLTALTPRPKNLLPEPPARPIRWPSAAAASSRALKKN
jgi:trigger factor